MHVVGDVRIARCDKCGEVTRQELRHLVEDPITEIWWCIPGDHFVGIGLRPEPEPPDDSGAS